MNNHDFTSRIYISCCLFLTMLIGALPSHAGYNYEELDSYLNPEVKTISMDFDGADLTTVLKMFSQQSGMNFIASSEISGESVSLYLDDVPVEEALERILAANELTYEVTPGSNIFVVKSATDLDEVQLMTRIYNIRHIPLPSSKLHATLSEFEDIGEEPDPEEDFGLVKAIEELISEDGSVVEDRRTNSLIITDRPSRFPMFEQTIARLDVRVPMVLIEAEMLDVAKNNADLLGAKWGESPVVFSGGSKEGLFPFDFDNIIADNVASNEPGDRDAFLGGSGRYGESKIDFGGLAFTLQFLRTRVDTKSLARPRILTLNNQTAEISIEKNEAVAFISTSSGADAGTTSSQGVPEREDTGVFLTVTPSANVRLGEITLAIEPRVVDATGKTTIGNDTAFNAETRGSKSILRVKDGDTIIMGGLLATTSSNVKTSVPLLGRLPIFGTAFRHKDATAVERELIIFITPQIVKDFAQRQPGNHLVQTQDFYREQDLASTQNPNSSRDREFSYFNAR